VIERQFVEQVGASKEDFRVTEPVERHPIGQRRIFQSQCIYADWTYERDGEKISTKSYYELGSAMCARGLEPGETAIQDGIGKAASVRRIPEGLQLEGGGYRIELRRRG
jgi:hypothetical protein